jgi:hypothetical protein
MSLSLTLGLVRGHKNLLKEVFSLSLSHALNDLILCFFLLSRIGKMSGCLMKQKAAAAAAVNCGVKSVKACFYL